MELHVFNPEHDIALAAGKANFTAPHAGRQLRADLGYLPVLWAKQDDAVLVDDAGYAQKAFRRLNSRCRLGLHEPLWVDRYSLSHYDYEAVRPWGWDAAVRSQLLRWGIDERLLPSEKQVEEIRQLSHRRTGRELLMTLRLPDTVGESAECRTEEEVNLCLQRWSHAVLKAPWSSSGRGVRFVQELNSQLLNWVKNVIRQQGCVMVEPYYKKVRDFGLEFCAHRDGTVAYQGLSLFHTANGAYSGNIIATETEKTKMLSRYVSGDFLRQVAEKICSTFKPGNYVGPFGVDMMVVAVGQQFLLHPCVEVNLRRTMGHVALALTPTDDDVRKVMRIQLTDNYKLKIRKL